MAGEQQNLMGPREFDNRFSRFRCTVRVKVDQDIVEYQRQRFRTFDELLDKAEPQRQIQLLRSPSTELMQFLPRSVRSDDAGIGPGRRQDFKVAAMCQPSEVPLGLLEYRRPPFPFVFLPGAVDEMGRDLENVPLP